MTPTTTVGDFKRFILYSKYVYFICVCYCYDKLYFYSTTGIISKYKIVNKPHNEYFYLL